VGMVVKERRGRRRYIAFNVEPRANDESILAYLRCAADRIGVKAPKVIQFDGTFGIVRTSPAEKEAMIGALNGTGEGFAVRTLATSGTLRTLRERFGKPKAEVTKGHR
jgi:RNase P/RNase MRP subunit POP5